MNSSYGLEKYAWARQEDLRRAARNIELMPLRPNSAGLTGIAGRALGALLLAAICIPVAMLILPVVAMVGR